MGCLRTCTVKRLQHSPITNCRACGLVCLQAQAPHISQIRTCQAEYVCPSPGAPCRLKCRQEGTQPANPRYAVLADALKRCEQRAMAGQLE